MKAQSYLALDLGASSGRAIVGTLDNRRLLLEEIHRFHNKQILQDSYLRWNWPKITIEITKAITKAVNKFELRSVGVDTWGVDFGLLDENDRLIELPITYRDSRTDGMIDEIYNQLEPKVLFKQTGNQAFNYNSLFQLYSLKLYRPEIFQKIQSLLFIPDLVNFYLTGEKRSEYTISTTSQLLDPKVKDWNYALLYKIGIPFKIFNRITFPGNRIGKVKSEFSSKKLIDVVSVGSHDTASAVAAIPAFNENYVFISSGTWSVLGFEMSVPNTSYAAMIDGFTNEGTVEGKTRFLQNVMGMWLWEESREFWKAKGMVHNYNELLDQAEKTKPFQTYINPDHKSFFNPKNMIKAVNEYCLLYNQVIPSNPGEYTRAIFESLALKYKLVIEKLAAHRKDRFEVIHIVGGGSQNSLLCQFTANATGLKVIAGPVEATAIGNIILQSITYGQIKNLHEAREIIQSSFTFVEYLPENEKIWKQYYNSCMVNSSTKT